MENGICKAVKAAGGRRQLAETLNVTRQAVEHWINGTWKPSPQNCLAMVEKLPGLTLHELRPDIYPK